MQCAYGQDVPAAPGENGEQTLIRLEGVVDVGRAAELKELLMSAFNSGRAMSVSLKDVTDLDITAVQLLWAALGEAERTGVRVSFDWPPPKAVRAALGSAGIEDFWSTSVVRMD
jgi:anti-anti-sigma regulatory factor